MFAKPQAELKFDDIEEYILLSGTLGRVDVGTMINSHKTITENNKSKFSYLVSSIFPPKSEMQYKYPYVKKHRSFYQFHGVICGEKGFL